MNDSCERKKLLKCMSIAVINSQGMLDQFQLASSMRRVREARATAPASTGPEAARSVPRDVTGLRRVDNCEGALRSEKFSHCSSPCPHNLPDATDQITLKQCVPFWN
jgi:hypothetical protein